MGIGPQFLRMLTSDSETLAEKGHRKEKFLDIFGHFLDIFWTLNQLIYRLYQVNVEVDQIWRKKKENMGPKSNFGSKEVLVKKVILVKKNFWSKKMLGEKKLKV